jgi:hypothetical protein
MTTNNSPDGLVSAIPMKRSAPIYDNALHLMEVQGGSFVKALAHCYYMADTPNKLRLRVAFMEYFDRYEDRFAAVARATGKGE